MAAGYTYLRLFDDDADKLYTIKGFIHGSSDELVLDVREMIPSDREKLTIYASRDYQTSFTIPGRTTLNLSYGLSQLFG